jgi:hypothetical protein
VRAEAQKVVEMLAAAATREEWREAFRFWDKAPTSTPEETKAILNASRATKARIVADHLQRGLGTPDFRFLDEKAKKPA